MTLFLSCLHFRSAAKFFRTTKCVERLLSTFRKFNTFAIGNVSRHPLSVHAAQEGRVNFGNDCTVMTLTTS